MTKFFEVLSKSAKELNGVSLPFTEEDLAQVPDNHSFTVVAPKTAEPKPDASAPAEVRPTPPASKPGYRTVSIRVPAGAPVLPFDGTHSLAAERYRIVRTKIVQRYPTPQVLCISSTTAGDGKTVNALNLASSFALKKDTTALLLDVDLRCPQLASLLGVPDSPGLADILAGRSSIENALVQIAEMPNLFFLPAGHPFRNPAELLDSIRWPSLIEGLRKQFHFIILDCPPMGIVADFDLIHPVADGIILVARPGHSKRKLLHNGLEQVSKDKLVGVLLNCVEDWFLWRTQDSSYYRYSYHAPNQQSR